MRTVLYIFTFCCLLSCTKPADVSPLLEQAERVMIVRPDSALQVLNRFYPTRNTLSKSDRMKLLLLRTEAMNKAYLPIDTVSYMPEVLAYYQRKGTAHQQARVHYLLGSIYRDRGNAPTALEYFKDAVKNMPADTENDHAFLSRIYAQMALLFREQRYPQQELPMWKEAHTHALKARDTLMIMQTFSRQESAYERLGKLDSALYIAQKTCRDYKAMGREDYAAGSLGFLIDYYLERDSLTSAKQAIDEYRTRSRMMNGQGEVTGRNEIFYSYLGEYYLKTHRNDSALYYYRLLLTYPDDMDNLEAGYRGLMSVYHQMEESDSVRKYALQFARINDSINYLKSAQEISRTQALYDFSESQQTARQKTEEAARLWQSIYLILMLTAVGVGTLSFLFFRQRRKEREELSRINRLYSDALKQYEKAESEMDLIKRDTEQAALQKAKEIEQLKNVILSYQDNHHFDKWNTEQMILQHPVVKQLHDYAAKGKVLSVNEWADLLETIQHILPDFCHALSCYRERLTEKEQIICFLIRLNFIPSEMGVLLNLSKQSISNIRAHINQKLFQETGTKTLSQNLYRLNS